MPNRVPPNSPKEFERYTGGQSYWLTTLQAKLHDETETRGHSAGNASPMLPRSTIDSRRRLYQDSPEAPLYWRYSSMIVSSVCSCVKDKLQRQFSCRAPSHAAMLVFRRTVFWEELALFQMASMTKCRLVKLDSWGRYYLAYNWLCFNKEDSPRFLHIESKKAFPWLSGGCLCEKMFLKCVSWKDSN